MRSHRIANIVDFVGYPVNRWNACVLACALWLVAAMAAAQPVQTYVLGDRFNPWLNGGEGIDPPSIVNAAAGLVDTTNTPGDAIEFRHKPGWISPLFFSGQENIAGRVLTSGFITAPNAGRGNEEQLAGTVNGDHLVAFERKPTLFEPNVIIRGIKIIMDFAVPVGVQRVRFYPRNTVEPTASAPFHNDFLRGYEVWVNVARDSPATPDALVARSLANEEPVVEIAVPDQYVRFLTIKSLAEVPFEIDEIEVYGTGYLANAAYLSDLIDLGARSTVGAVQWAEGAVGNRAFSAVGLKVRTGVDDTPILYSRNVYSFGMDGTPEKIGEAEVTAEEYFALERQDRVSLKEDVVNWSPWTSLENGGLSSAPGSRRYIQFRLDFRGDLFATRELDELSFDYVQPPIADTLRAEVFPRLARADEAATFRYAVRLDNEGEIRGYDRLEVDTNVQVEGIRQVSLNGEPMGFEVDFIRPGVFSISFPLIKGDGDLLEFTFDLPIFRFGTTFSGRAYNSGAGGVPHVLAAGNAVAFGPGDLDELSDLSVQIPRPQIGKLIGEIVLDRSIFSPNDDGANDRWPISFNVLQLLRPAPVSLEIFDLSGRKVSTVLDQERGIGPVQVSWGGRSDSGGLVPPGTYIWVLQVRANSFAERHSGVLAVVY
ncbi:MAG: hypothetical protein GKR89_05635 [Candidatus Latescibacteria bacterium]|nr:hypothetical protein [Candidatus Latescibacterota bacterium]